MTKTFHLAITNLEEFVDTFQGNTDSYYSSPFAILAELEKQIMFATELESIILMPYKEFGDAIFELETTYVGGAIPIAEYRFNSIVS